MRRLWCTSVCVESESRRGAGGAWAWLRKQRTPGVRARGAVGLSCSKDHRRGLPGSGNAREPAAPVLRLQMVIRAQAQKRAEHVSGHAETQGVCPNGKVYARIITSISVVCVCHLCVHLFRGGALFGAGCILATSQDFAFAPPGRGRGRRLPP